MTLGEAIVREILPEPKYVIAMYSYKKELEQLKKRIEGLSNPGLVSENEKLLEQLKRALEQADGLTEVFARQMTKPDESKFCPVAYLGKFCFADSLIFTLSCMITLASQRINALTGSAGYKVLPVISSYPAISLFTSASVSVSTNSTSGSLYG